MINHHTEFTVMTCNAGNGRAKPERLAQVLLASGADVIGLQEVSDGQAEALARQLSAKYPHQALFPGGFAGKAVLSRYPLVHIEQLQLSTVRPDLLVRLKMGELLLSLIVAHPPPPHLFWTGIRFDPQTWQQIQVLAKLAGESPPAILLGDFNLADWWGEYAYLRATGLQDAFATAGKKPGYTLPLRIGPWRRLKTINRMLTWLPLIPVLRVDYIWHTRELNSLDAWVGEDTGSDHLPVLARLALEANSSTG
jgi:endonuclease/exonuclease/phosphatase (EEP) superfamily protein YafD